MGLRIKFNASVIVMFLIGLGVAAAFAWRVTRSDAYAELVHQAELVAAQAAAIRGYTINEVQPLLAEHGHGPFLPQSIPAFAATLTLRDFARQFPGYAYKEAALNPTNPADLATADEAAIIDRFRGNAALTNIISTHDSPTGKMLSIFRPIRIADKECLVCHSTPAAAPATMIEVYGTQHGFGWNLNEVIGAQAVSVTMDGALQRADQRFYWFVVSLSAIFAAVLLLMNSLLYFMVVRPAKTMSVLAAEVARNGMVSSEFLISGRDELSCLGRSLNHMCRSLAVNLSEEWGEQAALASFGLDGGAD